MVRRGEEREAKARARARAGKVEREELQAWYMYVRRMCGIVG